MYILKVDGMTCGGCANAITKAVKSVDPQAEVNVDLGKKTVSVTSEQKLQLISLVIEEAGFTVTEQN